MDCVSLKRRRRQMSRGIEVTIASSTTAINLMLIAPYGRRVTILPGRRAAPAVPQGPRWLLQPGDELAVGGRSAAPRPHATGAPACAGGRRWARRFIPGKVLRVLKLILRCGDLEFVRCAVLATDHVEGAGRERHFLRSHAEETANADYERLDLSALVEQDITDVAYALVVGAEYVGALEFARQPLIGFLRRYKAHLARTLLGLRGRWAVRLRFRSRSITG